MKDVWRIGHRADPIGKIVADRHYNRQNPNSKQFVPPGRCVVLVSHCGRAVWTTSWPYAQYVKHAWAGAWVNSLFRNEGAGLSSELIQQALLKTLEIWPDPPALGIVTFVDAYQVRPKQNPGFCYIKAGFTPVGYTKGGLVALRMRLK